MSMSDLEFENDMDSLIEDYKWRIVERLRARDIAHRWVIYFSEEQAAHIYDVTGAWANVERSQAA